MDKKKNPVRFILALFLGVSGPAALALHYGLGWWWLACWLVPANLVAFVIWWHDRRQAERGGWRVPENALHAMAFLGAVPGSIAAMFLFRHKTLKPSFRWLYGLFLTLQVAALVWWLRRDA